MSDPSVAPEPPSLAKQSLHTLFFQSCGVLAGLVTSIILARSLGPEGRGTIDVANQSIALAVLLGGLSLAPGLMRQSAQQGGLPRELVRFMAIVAVVAALLAAAACTLLLPQAIHWGMLPTAAAQDVFWQVFIPASILLAGWSGILRGGLIGLDRIAEVNRAEFALKACALGGFAVLALAEVHEPSAYAALGATGAALILLHFFLKLRGATTPAAPDWRAVIPACLAIHGVNLLHFITLRSDVFFVQAQHGAREVGIYTLAVSFGQFILIASGAVAQPLLVEISRPGADRRAAARATATALRWFWIVGGVGVAGLAAGSLLIPLVFGREFDASVPALLLLLPGTIAFGSLNVATSFLFAQDMRRWNLVLAVNGALITVLGNLVLTPRFGAGGAAGTSSLAYCLTGALALWPVCKAAESSWHKLLVPGKSDWQAIWRTLLGFRL